jgi:hypothetical protein
MVEVGSLRRRLGALRRREQAVALCAGVARLFTVLVAGLLGCLLLDWLLDPPLWGRWLLVLGALAVAGRVFRQRLVRVWRRRLDDDELALRVEAAHPDLRHRLISTVQLSREQAAGRCRCSSELLEALKDETLHAVSPLNFLEVVDREALHRFLIVAACALAIQTLCLFRFPGYFRALACRLADTECSYPTRTRILELRVPEKVARGDPIPVVAQVDESSELPEGAGLLRFRSVADGSEVQVELNAESRGRYRGALAKAHETIEVAAFLGDARTRGRRVEVEPRPEVESGTIQYHWPEYIQRPDPPPLAQLGPLVHLQGGTVELSIFATKPLHAARLERRGEPPLALVPADQSGRSWRLAQPFRILRNSSFHFVLEDRVTLLNEEDRPVRLTNRQPEVEYAIEARPDAPPILKLKSPLKDATVTPRARPQLVFEARDDFGVREVWLVYRIQRDVETTTAASSDAAPPPERLELHRDRLDLLPATGDRQYLQNLSVAWNLEPLKLKPGDQLVFWIEGDDFCPYNNLPPARRAARAELSPPPEGEAWFPRSSDIKFTVVSQNDKTLELQTRIAKLLEELNALKEHQDELKAKVLDLLEAARRELEGLKKEGP